MAREVDAQLNPLKPRTGVDDPFGWDEVTQKIEKRTCEDPGAARIDAFSPAEPSGKALCQPSAFRKHPLFG